MSSEEQIKLQSKDDKSEIHSFISNSLINDYSIINSSDHTNIINIYEICSHTVKNEFDGDNTNDINSWDFSDWIKIILPIVKAIVTYNITINKGEYKKAAAVVITMCVIKYELDISDEKKTLLLNAVDSYLKPSIDTIVYIINSIDTGNLFQKCCPCFRG